MTEELMASLDVMAYGYEVSVKVNGIDLGFKGGKSESKRLFGADDPMAAEMPPEFRSLACLKPGENRIEVGYKRVPKEDSTGLTIEIHGGTGESAFRFREDPTSDDAPKSVTESFKL
jgi:hypothetical protein